jgi:hypothetical protein
LEVTLLSPRVIAAHNCKADGIISVIYIIKCTVTSKKQCISYYSVQKRCERAKITE